MSVEELITQLKEHNQHLEVLREDNTGGYETVLNVRRDVAINTGSHEEREFVIIGDHGCSGR